MKSSTPIVLSVFGALGLMLHGGAHAAVYVEAVDGDLSTDQFNPTAIALDLGPNTITGTSTSNPQDRDFFLISVGAGQQLESLVLTSFTNTPVNNAAFLAVDDQVGFDTLFSAFNYLGSTLFDVGDLGTDLLPLLGAPGIDGDGFDGPLGEGDYTFWYQETGGDTSYTFTANLGLVPEPGSAVALLLGAGGLLARRRRA